MFLSHQADMQMRHKDIPTITAFKIVLEQTETAYIPSSCGFDWWNSTCSCKFTNLIQFSYVVILIKLYCTHVWSVGNELMGIKPRRTVDYTAEMRHHMESPQLAIVAGGVH